MAEVAVLWSFVVGGSGGLGLSGSLVVAGSVAVVGLLVVFLSREEYRRPPRSLTSVEFALARADAESVMTELAPRAMLLAERERDVSAAFDGSVRDARLRLRVEELVGWASQTRFWERFAGASALVEEDPRRAVEELRGLRAPLEAALARLGEAMELLQRDAAVRAQTGKGAERDG